jgi:hypothetical protein
MHQFCQSDKVPLYLTYISIARINDSYQYDIMVELNVTKEF